MSGARKRGRGLIVNGAVIGGLALIVAVVSGVEIASVVGRPLGQLLTNPVLHSPVDTTLNLTERRYIVFEQTGHRSGAGGVQVSEDHGITLNPGEVSVHAPDGQVISTYDLGLSSQTLTRDEDIYTAAVEFSVTEPGSYRVQVTSPSPVQVIIGPSLSSGFAGVRGWIAAGVSSALVLVIGLLLLIVGLVRAGRRPSGAGRPAFTIQPAGSGPPAVPPPGWYPDPREPGRLRYFNGREWTADVRE
jgi:Protein of unknown function (DUF2510)